MVAFSQIKQWRFLRPKQVVLVVNGGSVINKILVFADQNNLFWSEYFRKWVETEALLSDKKGFVGWQRGLS